MKKGFFNRIVSLVLVLIMVVSVATVSLTATTAKETDEAVTGSVWGDTAVGFGINKIYSTGLVACGAVLTNIAAMTGSEEFQEIASFLNVWVFGGNPTIEILNEISQMCTHILSEVTLINEKLDIYTAEIKKQLSEAQFLALEKSRTDAWNREVEDVMTRHNIKNAFDAFINMEALDEDKVTSETEMSYFVSAQSYKSGTPDKNGKTHTQEDVQKYRARLFTKFCEMHGGIDSGLSDAERAKLLFETPTKSGLSMDEVMLNAIDELSDNLTSSDYDSYADACAQVAYQGILNLADQRDYVISNINRQVMTVTLTQMLYQEYLDMRTEYLKAFYSESDSAWVDYNNDVYGKEGSFDDSFKSMNESIKNDVENRLATPLKFNSNLYLAVSQLPDKRDLEGTVLRNSTYHSSFGSYDKEQPIIDYDSAFAMTLEDITSSAQFTTEYMNFNKLPVFTSKGVEMYYIYCGRESSVLNGTPRLVHAEMYVGNDEFLPSCDYINLTRGKYTDGTNYFTSASLPSQEAPLFSTNNYALNGSVPLNYLYEYLGDYSDKALYQIFPSYEFMQNGAFRDPHANVAVLDMKEVAPSLDLTLKEQQKLSLQDSYEGYDDCADGYNYVVILKNDATQAEVIGTTLTALSNVISYSSSGVYPVEMIMERADHSAVANNSKLTCGENITLKFKPVNNNTEFVSLKLYRYNDASSNEPTSEQVILDADDFTSLKQEDGYYIIDVNMPYTDAEFVIETAHKVNTDELGNYMIGSFSDLEVVRDKVNSGVEEYANGSYIVTNDIVITDDSDQWTSCIGSYQHPFKGTFDGQGHTISNLNNNNSAVAQTPLALFDRTNGATIKNLNLEVGFSTKNNEAAGLCIGASYTHISDCTVSGTIRVTADVGCEPLSTAGIVAETYSGTVLERCVNLSYVHADSMYVAGVCAYNGGTIKNCANKGSIKGDIINFDYMNRDEADASGITVRNTGVIESCYNIGEISGPSNNCSVLTFGNSPVNCVYLDQCASDKYATKMSAEQFKSGEAAYYLNNGVTDGTQAWYQRIDSGSVVDEFPTLEKSEYSYVFKVSNGTLPYSNTPDRKTGDADVDGKVTITDVTCIQRHVAQLAIIPDDVLEYADVNSDGIVSIMDATLIQRYIAQIISSFQK